ncbi:MULTISPECIES: Fic family protein [Amycolatopsis]|uniref:Fic family protein n=2 Tax=Amycolatopsis TaxID=1813 RepID=A0A1I3ZUZ2_9PSEU|nr:Fic family protein [Amycolatopsis sacchari]SFK47915.1 Fic family protein [Amycolatopsis sacchari]
MDPARFVAPEFGRPVKKPGDKWAFWYFEPADLPRYLDLSLDTVLALSRADAALGRLSGVGRLLSNPGILVQPYQRREAVASSRIEGTEASLSDVLQAEAAVEPTESDDIAEVFNYQRALNEGIRLLESLPISTRLIREIHAILLSGVRGQEKRPGELRTSPVWIGSPTDSPDTAVFVPPLPELLGDHLKDWENFVHEDDKLPILIKCALMHYQFETIHPFLDGNGRIGRLLITLLLIEKKVLELPLLYVSAYMETNRQEYYDRLQAVRERGEVQEWIQFFLTAVYRQATDAEERAGRLVELRESYRSMLAGTKSRAVEVVDLLFSNPFVTVKRVETNLGITNQGARNLLTSIEEKGILRKIGSVGRGGRIFWLAEDIYQIVG